MKKFFIRLIAAASAAAICITSVSAYSAQFDGEYFGEGFDAYDTDTTGPHPLLLSMTGYPIQSPPPAEQIGNGALSV